MILGDIIDRNALLSPNHAAIRCDGRTITHREHALRAWRFANFMIAQGVRLGDRVAVLAQNCPEYIEAYSACGVAGFVTVGLNYRLSAPEQAAILRDCEPAVLLFEAQYAERVQQLRSALSSGVKLLCIGGAPGLAQDYEAALASADAGRPAQRPDEQDTAYLIYTSGTTGRPKGVMLSHRGQLEHARTQALAACASPVDRELITMPYYHIGAKLKELTYTIVGATIVLHRAFDPRAVLESIERERVSAAHLAPTMIQAMLEVPECRSYDLSSLHTVFYASSPMSEALLRRAIAAFGPVFVQIYGMTECAVSTVLCKHQHVLEGPAEQVRRLASAGQPVMEGEVRIVREDGTDCAVGEVGEVWGRTKAMMQGYWRNPQATADVMVDGWMRTGDMGYFDDERFLFVADRRKDMIISGGENIYSREVEETLMLHPAVLEAAVIGVPDPKWGESVKAFVVFRDGQSTTQADLIEHCRSLIASYKKPKSVEFVRKLPRLSSTNKIDKKKLREPYWADRERQVS